MGGLGGGALSSALTLPCPTECGGQRTGPSGYLSSPNHPRNYPHQQVPAPLFYFLFFESERRLLGKLRLAKPSSVCPQLCIWHLSVAEGHVITLRFSNFSLETQDVCEFDYVEVHDGLGTRTGRVLGRWDAAAASFVCQTDVGLFRSPAGGHARSCSSHGSVCLFVSGSAAAPVLQI